MANRTIEGGTLYALNKELLRQVEDVALDISQITEVSSWATGQPADNSCRYFMFLCREKNDYTIFRIVGEGKEEEFSKQLKRLIYSRGRPSGIVFNETMGGYEFWIKDQSLKNEPFMYALFNCNDFIIEIK